MKKVVLFVATILLIIFGAETIYSNNDIIGELSIRYEIQSAVIRDNEIDIIGWALIHRRHHNESSESTFPKYYLRLINVHNPSDYRDIPNEHNDQKYKDKLPAYKYDLTCTLFEHSTIFADTECVKVLAGETKYEGLDGQAGVEAMVEDSKNLDGYARNFYYRNVGFKFVIPIEQLTTGDTTCAPGTNEINYRMQILIDLGDGVNKDNLPSTGNISIYEKAVPQSSANIKFENLPSSVNVKVTHGRVRMTTIDGPPFSTFYPDNSNPYVFTSPRIYVVDDYFKQPYTSYAQKKNKDDLSPYKVGYYGLYIVDPVSGDYHVTPGVKGDRTGYAPATWIEPDDGKSEYSYSHISIQADHCAKNEDEDHRRLSCKPNNPSPVIFGPKEGTFLENTACLITGDEEASVALPSYPGTIQAGTGFGYQVRFESHIKAAKEDRGRYLTIPEWEAAIAAAQRAVDDAEDDVNDAEDDIEHWERQLDAIIDYLEWVESLPGTPEAIEAAKKAVAEAEKKMADYERALRRAEDRLHAADVALSKLITEFNTWKQHKVICDNWTAANNYRPNPNIMVMAEGNDYASGVSKLEATSIGCTQGADKYEATCNLTYQLPQTYISKYDGRVMSSPVDHYYNGGRELYTDFRGRTGTIYNLDLEIFSISPSFQWRISYDCDYSVVNYFPPGGGGQAEGELSMFMFRPISLINPFPGRSPGSNWSGYKNYDFTKKNGRPLYDDRNVIYTVNLKPDKMKAIREYNRNNSYIGNYLLPNGKNKFVHSEFKELFEPGEGR